MAIFYKLFSIPENVTHKKVDNWYEDGLYLTNHFYIKGTSLLADFNTWAKKNGYNLDKTSKCSKTFYSNLITADISIQSKRKDGNCEHIHFQ